MSMRPVQRQGRGKGWEVRYLDGAGRKRSRTFDRQKDAQVFEGEVRRQKRLGQLAQLDAGQELVSDFAVEWWRAYARPNLAASTLRRYEEVWDTHLLDRIGDYRLREVTPEMCESLRVELERAGVGAPTIRKAMFLVQSILQRAVVRRLIASNPMREVRKPRQEAADVTPLSPTQVEAIRAQLEPRDRLIVSLIAYAGLRPRSEALNLPAAAIRERTLRLRAPKTRSWRTVHLLGPLAVELAEWRLEHGIRSGLLLAAPAGKEAWSEQDFRNWRKRVFQPACAAAGLARPAPWSRQRPYDGPQPYALRHSFVSLLIQEGKTIAYVADQAGHSPDECVRTYMHLIEDFDPTERVPGDEAIRAAREKVAADGWKPREATG